MPIRFFDTLQPTFATERSITAAGQWTNDGDGAEFDQRRPFNISVGGTFVATVTLQRSFDGGSTWHDVWATAEPAERIVDTTESGLLWRLGVKSGEFTSGSLHARMSQ